MQLVHSVRSGHVHSWRTFKFGMCSRMFNANNISSLLYSYSLNTVYREGEMVIDVYTDWVYTTCIRICVKKVFEFRTACTLKVQTLPVLRSTDTLK